MKIVTIKNSGLYSKTIYRGKSLSDKFLIVYYISNGQEESRIGISVGKKTGNSVQRNRIKRLIREAYRIINNELEVGYDIVFIPRKLAVSKEIKMVDIFASMSKLFKKINILKKMC